MEIDLLRTAVLILMIAYHLLYDLQIFYGADIDLFSASWTIFERITAGIFLLLVGVSFSLSWDRAQKIPTIWGRYAKYFKRGIGLILCGEVL